MKYGNTTISHATKSLTVGPMFGSFMVTNTFSVHNFNITKLTDLERKILL